MDERAKQLQYEIDTDSEAATARLEQLRKDSREGLLELPRTQAYIARAYAAVRDSIVRAQEQKTRGVGGKFKGWLRELNPELAAVIALRECIHQCTLNKSQKTVTPQTLLKAIGKLYELEVKIAQAEKVNPMYMQKVQKRIDEHNTTSTRHLRGVYNKAYQEVMKGAFDSSLTQTELMHFGKFGLQACMDAGVVYTRRGYAQGGSLVTYELNPDVLKFLTDYDEADVRSLLNKSTGAMLCPPDPWTNLRDGGYISARRKMQQPLMSLARVRKKERARLRKLFTAENMPKVFETANYLQSIPYTVHAPTLAAIRRVWGAGGGVLGVPSKNPPEGPAFPFKDDWDKESAPEEEVQVFTRWKFKKAEHYDELRQWRGRVREIGGFIRTAGIVQGNVWFPVFMDGRGRWYYRGLPNPQGSDLAKGTLHFGNRKPLGKRGLYWLKVHIANSFGFDKKDFDSRAAWTDANWEAIERALDAPEDYPDVWGTDAPWCMYSAAWELREAYRSGNPEAYCTGVPVHMDATCSGLQHFSALMRDPVGGLYVNLTGEHNGEKQDIYAKVANTALQGFQNDREDSDQLKAGIAAWWVDYGIPRALAKKPVMTYVYGATLRGTAQSVQHALLEMQATIPPQFKDYEVAGAAGKRLFQGVEATVPAAASTMRWFRSIVQQMPRGKGMEWTTPLGFRVRHDYQGYDELRIKIRSCGVDTILIREDNEDTNPHQMQNAIAPNFVHALDATHLAMTALAMKSLGLDMVGIHDSFGTHPCDVDAMHKAIREEFVKLYENNKILEDFMWEVGAVGSLPMQGTLDIRKVLTSPFFYC